MANQNERDEKLQKIISSIYVEAHIKEHPNMVEYHGSLSPEETKIVKDSISQINQLFNEGKDKSSILMCKHDFLPAKEFIHYICKKCGYQMVHGVDGGTSFSDSEHIVDTNKTIGKDKEVEDDYEDYEPPPSKYD